MLEQIFETLKKYFGILASSLTGITTVLTAVGYLAEHSHYKMLGFSSAPFDVNQFLITGAMFFAFLPKMMFDALLFVVGNQLLNLIEIAFWPVLVMVGLIIAWRLGLKKKLWSVWQRFLNSRPMTWLRKKFPAGAAKPEERPIAKRFTFLLTVFLLFQLTLVHQMTSALRITNLLFAAIPPADPTPGSFFASSELLALSILQHNDHVLFVQMAILLTCLFIITVMLWHLMGVFRRAGMTRASINQKFLIGLNLILFATELILVPMNHGILNISKSYAEVEVLLSDAAETELNLPRQDRLVLLLENSGGYYIYALHAGKIWFIKNNDVRSLVYGQKVTVFAEKGWSHEP